MTMARIDAAALKTVHVVGDSHALAFKGKSVSLPDYGLVVNASVEYVPGLTTDKLVTGRQLHPEIAQYFLRTGIITKEGVRAAATEDGVVIGAQYASGLGFQKPMVIFLCGEIFIRNTLGALLAKGPLKLSDLREIFNTVVQNYIRDIVSIRTAFGLHAVVHEICPPTADDRKFEEINEFACPGELRAEAYNIFNSLLLEATLKHNVPFCRSADHLAVNGLLAEEFEFDGVHADPKHAYMSLERTVSLWLHTRGGEKTDRFVPWVRLFAPNGYKPEITQLGISQTFTPFDSDQLAALRSAIGNFEGIVCKKPTLCWAHQPPTMGYGLYNETITYGDISPAGLRILRDVLIAGPFGERVRKLFGAKYSIINVRPVHSLPHSGEGIGQQAFHRDGCPPGVFRALIYLNDVSTDNGAFEYIPVGATEPTQATGRAGSTFFFDANVVTHRATPPRTGERLALDLILLAHPDSCTEIADCRVGFNWPIDPYMFAVSENCQPRLKADRWFYPAFVASKISDNRSAPPAGAAEAPKRAAG
jgi:hypothetical protein